jgi:hypothetical protein
MRNTLCLLLLAALPAWGQKKPNLSGTWELDLSRSDFGSLPPPKSVVNVIQHKEPFIKVESTMETAQGKFPATLQYRSTGAQDTNSSHGTVMSSWSKWFGDEFVIEGEVVAGTTYIKFKETWKLADAGRTLLVHRVMATPKREIPQKLVFTRKGVK